VKRPYLTAKRQRFVDAYCGEARFQPSLAAKIAGFGSPRTVGSRLTKELAEEIDAKLVSLASKSQLSAEAVVQGLSELAQDSKNPAVRCRALEILAKIHGLVTDKVSLTVDRKAVTGELDGILDSLLSQPKADQPPIHKDSN
jgi:hypothetical protein